VPYDESLRQTRQRASLVSGNFSARRGQAGVLTLAGAFFFLVAAFTLLGFASGGRDRENFFAREDVWRRVPTKPEWDPRMLAHGQACRAKWPFWRVYTGAEVKNWQARGHGDFAVAEARRGAVGLRGKGLRRRPLDKNKSRGHGPGVL
jgi:hypothetical protein